MRGSAQETHAIGHTRGAHARQRRLRLKPMHVATREARACVSKVATQNGHAIDTHHCRYHNLSVYIAYAFLLALLLRRFLLSVHVFAFRFSSFFALWAFFSSGV
jgi:hypothetical protein